VVALLLRPL